MVVALGISPNGRREITDFLIALYGSPHQKYAHSGCSGAAGQPEQVQPIRNHPAFMIETVPVSNSSNAGSNSSEISDETAINVKDGQSCTGWSILIME